jgi:hypothetical protein
MPSDKVKVGETYEVTHHSNARPGTQSIFAGICVANGDVSATFEIVQGDCRSDRDGYRACGQNVRLSHSSFQAKQISEAISDLDSDPPRRRRSGLKLADALESSAQKIRERLEHK